MSTPYARLAGVYDEYVVDPCHADWAAWLDGLWQGHDVRTVLDVCCGTGLMTAQFAARGLDVVGVDASPEMLALARRALGPDVALVHAVLPDLGVTGTFDAAVSTLDGFNYLTSAEFAASLAALAAHVRDDGWLVFDLHAEAILGFARAHPVLTGEQDGSSFTLTTTVDDEQQAVRTVIDLVARDPGDSFTEEHVQYVHADTDVRAALEAAGFDRVRVTDEYTDAPLAAGSLRATWVARRRSRT